MEFRVVRKGYDKKEVDEYIERLTENYESRLSKQKDRIFYLKNQLETKSTSDEPLLDVSLGKQAKSEGGDQNLYYVEAKRLMLIYGKMEQLLSSDNLSSDAREELLSFIKNCKKSLEDALSRKKVSPSQDDTIKKLLAKMMGLNINKTMPNTTEDGAFPEDIKPLRSKTSAITQRKTLSVKNNQESKKKQDKKEKNEFSNFLSKSSPIGSNFESIMFKGKDKGKKQSTEESFDYSPNETGFDLKAAVNPTEDLNEIMKAFDFYNDKKSKK
jgi:DivIVA domain-containing protein